MYSDDWRRQGYTIEKRILIFDAVYLRHAYDPNGNPAGVIIDYELADDFHYELLADAYAGINAFGAEAFTEPVRRAARERSGVSWSARVFAGSQPAIGALR